MTMLRRILIFWCLTCFLCTSLSLAADVNNSKIAGDDFDAAFGDEFNNNKPPRKLIADPLEPINRGVFWVNDKLYFYLFKPVAKGYRLVIPRPARVSVSNVFSNLATPIRAGNALLQLKYRDFGTEIYRFVINTTFGIGGLFDPAESVAGVKPRIEDFGQTLGYYGAGHGFYLVLPVVGPSSLRDGMGSFVDSFADPFRYADLETEEYLWVKLLDATNRLSLDRDTYEGIVRDSIDPYLFIRTAYAQRRLAQVGENTYNINLFQGPLFDSDLLNPLDWFGN
jgi:phospholipid-binding lipoprotein MlaA